MTSRPWWVLFGAAMVLTGVTTAGAQAAEARLARVRLLRTGDRMSLALEMTAEPQKAALRALSARVFEVEAGPVIGPIRAEDLAPPSGVSLIKQVSIRKFILTNGAVFVRARVTLHEPARGNVRVVGRIVYVDVTAAGVPPDALPEARIFAYASPEDSVHARTGAPPAPSHSVSYPEAVRPLVARLTEIGPFLVSATAAPVDDVLEVLGRTLRVVEERLRALDVPRVSRPAHDRLVSAVAMATRAVAPEFRGDRVAEARRALALVETVRDEIR